MLEVEIHSFLSLLFQVKELVVKTSSLYVTTLFPLCTWQYTQETSKLKIQILTVSVMLCFQDVPEGTGSLHWLPRISGPLLFREGERFLSGIWICCEIMRIESCIFAICFCSVKMKDLQIYEAYCQNKPRSESLWRQCSDCAFFQVTSAAFLFFFFSQQTKATN